MKKSLVLRPHVQKRLRELPENDAIDALFALLDLSVQFGNPHAHSGLGIRKLGRDVFECRAGLRVRCGFVVSEENLTVEFLGNHDELRRWMRDL